MTQEKNLFTGELQKINDVDVDAPIANLKDRCCEHYMFPYFEAAKKANEDGDEAAFEVYRLLGTILSFHPNFDFPENPYEPHAKYESGETTPIPNELTKYDIEAIKQLTTLSKDTALRSRLFDLVWIVKKDHKACAEAVESYIATAEKLDGTGDVHHATKYFQRGIQLASKLGRDKPLFESAIHALEKAAKSTASDPNKSSWEYLNLCLQFRCVDPSEFASISTGIAKKATEEEEFYGIIRYWGLAADFHKIAQNHDEEKFARIEAAKGFLVQTESHVAGPVVSYMAAAGVLSQGIEALRQAGAQKDFVKLLREKLKEYQQKSIKEFGSIPIEIDNTDGINHAKKVIENQSLEDALINFAFGEPLLHPNEVKEEVLEIAKETPLMHILGTKLVDKEGRPTGKKDGFLHAKGEERESALQAELFSHASFYWLKRATGYIRAGRLQILNDHEPTLQDLSFLVTNNPFIPPGHERIFLRGIHAGFHGDLLASSHFLVPQIENSLRYVLESQNVDVSNLNSDGLQPLKMLGALFAMPETTNIFGEEFCFELRGFLIEKTGYSFRDRIAHGFVSEADCYSVPAENIWWLILRLCIFPIARVVFEKRKSHSSKNPS